MEKKKSIKQAAQFIDISDNGIRYLEKKGLVKPERGEESGYRYYKDDDLAMLYFYRTYKEDGLGLPDIQKAFGETADEVSQRLEANLSALKSHAAMIERNTKATEQLLCRVSETPSWGFEDRPHFAFVDEYDENIASSKDKKFYKAWFGLTPFLSSAIRYALDDSGTCRELTRGSIVARDNLADNDLASSTYVNNYPAESNCFYVSLSYPNSISDEEELQVILDLFAEHAPDAVACGTILGRLLHMRQTDKEFIYYAEYWIPYRKES